jgi:hypothetical protein
MKKVIWTLVVDDYPKEITALTFPLIQSWAMKIGAEFWVINTREFPGWPPVYEKLQIFKLGKENDWNIYIDADALIKPDLFDFTAMVPKDTVVFTGQDMSANRFRPDNYFMRDGRYIGACNWFTAASDLCIDLWHPLEDLTLEEAVANIYPTLGELGSQIIKPEHLIDDYILSRNIARYGLKHETIKRLQVKLGREMDAYFWHHYTVGVDEKVAQMKQVLKTWGLLA